MVTLDRDAPEFVAGFLTFKLEPLREMRDAYNDALARQGGNAVRLGAVRDELAALSTATGDTIVALWVTGGLNVELDNDGDLFTATLFSAALGICVVGTSPGSPADALIEAIEDAVEHLEASLTTSPAPMPA